MENYNEFKNLEAFNASLGFEPIGNNIPLKDFFKNEECDCGYAPHERVNKQIVRLMKKNKRSYGENLNMIEENIQKEGSCPGKYALCNHITFPPVSIMSNCNEASDIYYDTETGQPRVHWALIMEINHLLTHPNKIGLGGFNMYGDEVHVYFANESDESPGTFSWNDLREGNTIVILYPEQKTFPNGDSLIVEANLDSCFVFKESLEMVKQEANSLLLDAELMVKNEVSSCFSCGYSNSSVSHTLIRCANCKLAKYCSKECQSYAWKESHKRLCSQNETLLRLSTLHLIPFSDFLTFNPSDKLYLPPFKQISEKRLKKRSGSNYKESEDKENQNIQSLSKLMEKKCGLFEVSPKKFPTDINAELHAEINS